MIEKEMEDLLREYPEKFLNQSLEQFRRQPGSSIGRADLVFKDGLGRLLVVELKKETLSRKAVGQLVDYFGMLKQEFGDTPVELMAVANRIPPERRFSWYKGGPSPTQTGSEIRSVRADSLESRRCVKTEALMPSEELQCRPWVTNGPSLSASRRSFAACC
jgi:hypothetical protein